MLKTLIIGENSLLPETWERFETEDVLQSLIDRFGGKFPENARLYNGQVSKASDVTPNTEAEIEAIGEMAGPFYAICYPQSPLVIAAFAIVALVVIAAIVLRPKVPVTTNRNVQSTSPNNAFSGRTNAIRINGRIPDIFGQVRSTPDLIAVPYSVFEDNVEVEYCFMCIGRGTYGMQADDIRDGQTPCQQIDKESIEVWGPNTSPNLPGGGFQLRIGDAITREVISAMRSKSVNGQTLLASNEGALNPSTMHFNFANGGVIYFNVGDPGGVALDTLIHAGDTITLTTNGGAVGGVAWNTYSAGAPSDPTFTIISGDAVSERFDASVKFHSDGRIEFSSPMTVGLNPFGYGYIELSNAAVTDGTHNADLKGKYVVTQLDASTLQVENPLLSSTQWSNLSAFSGAVSPTHTASFFCPHDPIANVSGTYTVAASPTTNTIPLVGATLINSDWAWINHLGVMSWITDQAAFINLGTLDIQWVGPFVLDVTTTTELITNFVAVQGMYKDDGTAQTAASVDIQIGATPCSSSGVASGPEQFFNLTMVGSSVTRSTIAKTLYSDVSAGRYMVRARRVTPKDLFFVGQISDEVKWRDLYSSSPVGSVAFGDITTVHCKTVATAEALAVSERQINMLVTRMIPIRISGDTFTPELHATTSADHILSFICLDPKLGNRAKAEVNFDNIYDTIAAVKAYFGIDEAGQFNYTIDSDNLSFEDTVAMVAGAVFCNAHRRGNVIEITFEQQQDTSRILFNHRNKVPNSEQRSITFGNIDDYDGVEYDYVSPVDDAIVTYYIPEDRTAVKPRKIESIGVRSVMQAYLHAYREYNKLLYQHLAVEFEATQETDVLAIGDRILVADNTRPDTQDGQIEEQDGLTLKLSQPAVLKSGVGYVISLQLPSAVIENIDITPGVDPYHVVLSAPPSEDLVTDEDSFTKTLYQIIRAEDGDKTACIITTKAPNTNFTSTVQAINYDARYYQNDLDFA